MIGAAPSSVPAALRAATVSMRVAAAAPCSVTVVRPLGARAAPSQPCAAWWISRFLVSGMKSVPMTALPSATATGYQRP